MLPSQFLSLKRQELAFVIACIQLRAEEERSRG